ncbi:MAG TPA: chemotaxis protein CheB [Burkholderiaceae bacterium]|nr:chemotaxis protein CheB [Burkholderiaceae bacterium]
MSDDADGPAPLGDGIDALVIGASAGGVDALCQLLPALPPNARAAVCVVLHLPRERPSLLAEIFAPRCRCPVIEACDKQSLEPGKVYVAPPDYHLLIDAGPRIALSFDEPVHFSRPSIDVLFESAADVFRERLAGMLLTGGNEDGAAGLQTIRNMGGRTYVQRPDEAQAWMMPQAALDRGPVDAVLSLDRLAALIGTLAVRAEP